MAEAGGMAGRPLEGMPSLGRERRRQARALALWEDARGERPLPLAAAMPLAGTAATRRAHREIVVDGVADRDAAEAIRAALAEAWPRIARLREPLAFSLSLGERRICTGLLLPYAQADGALAALHVLAGVQELASRSAGADVAGGVAADAGRRAVPRSASSPWAVPADGAAALLRRAALPPMPVALQLGAARTWAALALRLTGPAQEKGRRAARAAAYDFLLGLRDTPDALGPETADAFARDPGRTVALLVFTDETLAELAEHAEVLAEGLRLRLDSASFVTFVEAAGAGRPAGIPAADEEARPLQLLPVDRQRLVALGRQRAFRDVAPTPAARAA